MMNNTAGKSDCQSGAHMEGQFHLITGAPIFPLDSTLPDIQSSDGTLLRVRTLHLLFTPGGEDDSGRIDETQYLFEHDSMRSAISTVDEASTRDRITSP
jgi:hypothetical protein